MASKRDTSPYTKKESLSKEEFKELVKTYFKDCDSSSPTDPYLLPALAESLNWTIHELIGYPGGRKYSSILDKAKLKCEVYLSKAMFTKKIDKSVGAYMLKAYFGYKDKSDAGSPLAGKVRTIKQILDEIEDSAEAE